MYVHVFDLIEISIRKPCTDNCGGLIEPVTFENHVNLAVPIF